MCSQKRQYLKRFPPTADGVDYNLSCEGIAYSTILDIAGVFLFPMRIDELPLSNLDFSVHLLALLGSLHPRPTTSRAPTDPHFTPTLSQPMITSSPPANILDQSSKVIIVAPVAGIFLAIFIIFSPALVVG